MPQKTTKAGISFSNSNKLPTDLAVSSAKLDMQGKRHGWPKLLSRIAPSALHLPSFASCLPFLSSSHHFVVRRAAPSIPSYLHSLITLHGKSARRLQEELRYGFEQILALSLKLYSPSNLSCSSSEYPLGLSHPSWVPSATSHIPLCTLSRA